MTRDEQHILREMKDRMGIWVENGLVLTVGLGAVCLVIPMEWLLWPALAWALVVTGVTARVLWMRRAIRIFLEKARNPSRPVSRGCSRL